MSVKANSGQVFLSAMNRSKYIEEFRRIPGLLDGVGHLLDDLRRQRALVCIGVYQNFDFKFENGNVIARVAVRQPGGAVSVSGSLHGRSRKTNRSAFYQRNQQTYSHERATGKIRNEEDVEAFLRIVRQFVMDNPDQGQER